MSFDWNDFILLAQEIRNQDLTELKEAKLRTVINRAYYGIFNLAFQKLLETELPLEMTGSIHRNVAKSYEIQKHNPTKNSLGLILSELSAYRKEADYEVIMKSIQKQNFQNNKEFTNYCWKLVEKALELLEKI